MLPFNLGTHYLAFTFAVIFHEFCHAEVAQKLGYTLNEIKLMPYGASLTGAFEGVKWQDEIFIAAAGPLSNAFLCVIFVALWWFFPSSYFFTELFVAANLTTFLINLLPIFPLDGGRILLAFLSVRFKRQSAYKFMRICGLALGGVLLAFSVYCIAVGANITLWIFAGFVFFSSLIPDKASKYQRLYSLAFRLQKIDRGLQARHLIISANASPADVFRQLNSNYYHIVQIMDTNQNIIAQLTETQLEQLALDGGYQTPFKKLIR